MCFVYNQNGDLGRDADVSPGKRVGESECWLALTTGSTQQRRAGPSPVFGPLDGGGGIPDGTAGQSHLLHPGRGHRAPE